MDHNHKRTPVPKGSDIKLAITVTSLGDDYKLSDQEVDIEVSVTVKDYTENFVKADLRPLSDDTMVLPLSTTDFPRGDMYLTTRTSVPDTDFDDDTRDEVQTIDTGITII